MVSVTVSESSQISCPSLLIVAVFIIGEAWVTKGKQFDERLESGRRSKLETFLVARVDKDCNDTVINENDGHGTGFCPLNQSACDGLKGEVNQVLNFRDGAWIR